MSNRREFIQTAALAAVPLAAGAGALLGVRSAAAAGIDPADLHVVVYDDRFADSVAFAREARRQGLRTVSLEQGDVTRLWYHDLYYRWKKGPAAIAGLTTPQARFVLETFGNDAGLRLAFEGEHHRQGGRVQHRLKGSSALVQQAALEHCGEAWSARMAQLVARCPSSRKNPIEANAASTITPHAGADGQRLVSWVLTPTARI